MKKYKLNNGKSSHHGVLDHAGPFTRRNNSHRGKGGSEGKKANYIKVQQKRGERPKAQQAVAIDIELPKTGRKKKYERSTLWRRGGEISASCRDSAHITHTPLYNLDDGRP